MDSLFGFINTHQLAVISVVLIALVAVYFLIKNLVKLALITILVLILVGTYFFLRAPARSPGDLVKAWHKVKGEAVMVVEKGKSAVRTGEEVLRKGEQVSKGVLETMRKAEKGESPKRD